MDLRLANVVLDQLPLAVAVTNAEPRLQYWNMRAASLLGVPPLLAHETPLLADMIASATGLTPKQQDRLTGFCLEQIAAGDAHEPDSYLRLTLGRGNRLLVQVRGLGAGQWMLLIDDRKSLPSGAMGLANTGGSDASLDPLTGLSNRRHCNEVLREAVAEAEPDTTLALLLIDLDRFQAINDTLGHSIGDALLCLVAQRLRREVREEDLLARLGGDEFVILARRIDACEALAGRIVDILSRPFLVEGHMVNIAASVGIAQFPRDSGSAEDLMRHADLALYDAKSGGRRTWRRFLPAMAAVAELRRALETDLRVALPLDQFFLVYQPQLNMRSKTVTGFEALMRWNHPVRGTIPPDDFIPVAEDIGCIIEMGEWALKAACLEAARWPGDLTVAVNVSPRQLEDSARLFAAVQAALAQSGLGAGRLEIEITESALLAREDEVLRTLHRLRDLGVRIAMDDFGTGYSSLSQLRSFPFTKIKIDRTFISSLGQEADSTSVIRAITALGAGLGMTTTVEGVETAEQLALVHADGCTDVQGYLVSRPIDASAIDGLLAQYNSAGKQGTDSPIAAMDPNA